MKFEETVQCCFDCYPSLFIFRWEVLAHLFCTYGEGGNGYKWIDGELISLGDDRDALYVPRLAEGEQASQPLEPLKQQLREYYTDIYENANMREYIEQQIQLNRDFPQLNQEVLSFEERVEAEVVKDIANKEQVNLWCLNDGSAMFTKPDNIKPDWLAGVKEAVELALEHGFGEIKEMSDWKNEEYQKTITALYALARELGVMT